MARPYKNRKQSKPKRKTKRECTYHKYIVKNDVILRYRDPESNLVVKTVTYHSITSSYLNKTYRTSKIIRRSSVSKLRRTQDGIISIGAWIA